MARKQLNKQYYSPAQTKKILGLTDNMLYYHVRNKTLQPITPPGRKQSVYLREEVDRLAKDMEVFFATRKIEFDSNFIRATKEDIPELVEISRSTFGGNNLTPVERRIAWLEKNPEIFYVLRNKSDNYMLGYTCLIPLKPQKIEKILREEEKADIYPDDIETYEVGKPLQIYVMAVAVRAGVSKLQKREYGFRLINGLVDRFVEMGKQGIIIERFVGRSNKPDGINILQGMGFSEVESPVPSTRLFILNVEEAGAPTIRLYKRALHSRQLFGRGIPKRNLAIEKPEQADSAILQMLLAPGRDMVQLSYMLWIADQAPLLEEKLQELTITLDQALISYHGEFLKPAQQLLAYTHQMRGRIAFDRLDLASASGHFSEMVDLGNELNDPDIITTAMVYQGSLLRKRGRFETAIRRFESAKPFADAATETIRGMYHVNFSTVYADSGQEKLFLKAIDAALEIAKEMKESLTGLANDFTLDEVLWAQAGGFSELWKPADALKIYEQTDTLRPFRPLRELGAYTIDKGEAYLRLGNLDEGITLSLKGIQLASEYQSKRHLGWVEKTYNRLRVLPIGKEKKLDTLRDALVEAKRKVEG